MTATDVLDLLGPFTTFWVSTLLLVALFSHAIWWARSMMVAR